jgi:hypothetical protein
MGVNIPESQIITLEVFIISLMVTNFCICLGIKFVVWMYTK